MNYRLSYKKQVKGSWCLNDIKENASAHRCSIYSEQHFITSKYEALNIVNVEAIFEKNDIDNNFQSTMKKISSDRCKNR